MAKMLKMNICNTKIINIKTNWNYLQLNLFIELYGSYCFTAF